MSANQFLGHAALTAVLTLPAMAGFAEDSDKTAEQPNTVPQASQSETTPAQAINQPRDNAAHNLADYSPYTPYGRQYALMREELARYSALASGDNWQPLPDGQALAPGMRDPRVSVLRGLLMQYGDYVLSADQSSKEPNSGLADEYDGQLRQAVERFQSRHRLKSDGVVDKHTRAQLNIPPARRVHTLSANLKRWQEMPKDLGPRYIVVNIPEFTLRLMDHGQEQYRMRVVVGKTKHKTPQLSTRMTRVVFNPTWTVPSNIAARELLPKGSANLAAGGYRLINQRGKSVPFSGSNLRGVRLGSVALQQRGGEGNALGRFKFVIPNQQAIFLHDTNRKELFRRNQRAFSHGCIRLEDPQELARIVLASQSNKWNAEKLAQVTSGSRTRSVALEKPIPVYIAYWTAWVDEKGRLQFRPDIYDRDQPPEPAQQSTSDDRKSQQPG